MLLRKYGAFLAVAALTAALLTPLCGLLYRCGCAPPWSEGQGRCNVQRPEGPHCPWCEHQALGALAAALTLGGQALVFRAVRRRSATATAALVAALALPPITIVAGALTWLPTNYPHFLVEDARARMGLPEGPIPCYGKRPAVLTCCGTGRPIE